MSSHIRNLKNQQTSLKNLNILIKRREKCIKNTDCATSRSYRNACFEHSLRTFILKVNFWQGTPRRWVYRRESGKALMFPVRCREACFQSATEMCIYQVFGGIDTLTRDNLRHVVSKLPWAVKRNCKEKLSFFAYVLVQHLWKNRILKYIASIILSVNNFNSNKVNIKKSL